MNPKSREWLFCDLPEVDYNDALAMQRSIVTARNNGRLTEDVMLMLEHPPVYTLGRRGGMENLTVSEDFLAEKNIPVVQIERGGNITYHGPGQLVIYPIVDLKQLNLSVTDFVEKLEEVMLRVAAEWHIPAERNDRNRGVWVGLNKLGSIGINIRHGVTFHGLALNGAVDLTPFEWIKPCGLSDVGMTSMQRESDVPVDMLDVRASSRRQVEDVFGIRLKTMTRNELVRKLEVEELWDA
ncbi:Octanoate-[acyl-carrier-protein]-protein-N-octanoyltransferase (EC [Olavius algarvensis associated proteobacterium Delta 3]|nr:Octanoate-[acyl-carrier-protein]-protein-N-octanoyltransferase (EC [Olavius algarvensis associated proteobacterium Delta 3]